MASKSPTVEIGGSAVIPLMEAISASLEARHLWMSAKPSDPKRSSLNSVISSTAARLVSWKDFSQSAACPPTLALVLAQREMEKQRSPLV
jgi:hypothetical protein